MSRMLGWVFVLICAICAPLFIILSFTMPDLVIDGGPRVRTINFLIPIVLGWLAVLPRSVREWRDLWTGNPFAQRFFGRKPAGFFGDYRRRRTMLGHVLLFGSIGLFALCLYSGTVHVDMFIIGFLFIVSLSSWIIRLELNGDQTAAMVRQVASALVYRPGTHRGT